jgi:hypothetical protein
MNSNEIRSQNKRPQIALVQGESFRCVAVEITNGRWKSIQEGTELPPVLEVLKIMGNCDASFFGTPKD